VSRALRPELREFIFRYCPTAMSLAVLLRIQAHPDRTWTPRDLQHEIPDLHDLEAGDLLAAFYGQGLLTAAAAATYRYQPSSPELAKRVTDLVRNYAERPADVLEEIASLARVAPLRSFADAFVIRKERKRG
jgi:hypothetical protein